jgi:hypothetical protein
MAPDVITFVITYLFVVFSTLRFSLFSKNTNGSLSVAIGTASDAGKLVAEIVVDEECLVLNYEGLWQREGNQ